MSNFSTSQSSVSRAKDNVHFIAPIEGQVELKTSISSGIFHWPIRYTIHPLIAVRLCMLSEVLLCTNSHGR